MYKSIIPAILVAALAAMPGMAQQRSEIRLQENAPGRYIVVPGDTLWGIAGKFLKDPWRWPEIWKLNQDQLKNPHAIYPGDVIVLDRSGSDPRLRMGETVKLSPRVRSEPGGDKAIPSIPSSVIEPFLSRPLVIEPGGLEKAPRIVAAQADRVNMGKGDVAYVKGIANANLDSLWQIYRQGKPFIDPETQKALGYEAIYLGSSKVTRSGDPATITIFNAEQEIGAGDRLVAAPPLQLTNSYAPHAPANAISGRILATYGGLRETGPQNIIAINRGTSDGLELGHVLALSRLGRTVQERRRNPDGKWYSPELVESTKLPDERYGVAFVFRTFNRVSYALVMSATRTVLPSDVVTTP